MYITDFSEKNDYFTERKNYIYRIHNVTENVYREIKLTRNESIELYMLSLKETKIASDQYP